MKATGQRLKAVLLGVFAVVITTVNAPANSADLNAVLDWAQRVDLSVAVSGVVEQVNAQPGQTVAKGEVLLTLDPAEFKAEVAEAGADIERLQLEEADARRDLDRVQELYARTVSSTTELDASKLRYARSAALLKAAQARVDRANHRLSQSTLKAPFDAVVLERRGEPGMVVASQNQPPTLFSLARADTLIARAHVDGAQVASIKLGASSTVIVAGRSLAGRVQAVVATSDGRYHVEVAFPRASGLVAGSAASIRLP